VKASEAICRQLHSWLAGSLVSALFSLLCCPPSACHAAETVILTVSLNTVSFGELFLKRTDTGSLLMLREDMLRIGLNISTVPATTLDGASYLAFEKLPGVTMTLNEKLLTLDLLAGVEWIDLPRIDKNYSPLSHTYTPSSGTSAFFNYRADYGNGIDISGATWSTTGQAGLRRGNLLLLGDGMYQHDQTTQQAVRLMTNLSWDRPESSSRWVAGDIQATAGEYSGSILLGGLSYASEYSMAPGLVTYPLGEFSGMATLPSEADIYVNGVLVRREHLSPGDYRFRNLPVANGTNNVEILLRDSFGNETRTATRFYLTDHLLKSGLHEYSYNFGFRRRDYGSASNNYDLPLLVASHTFGIRDYLATGSGVEAGNGLVNLMPRIVLGLADSGVLTLMGGESHDHDRGWGTTVGGGYQLQTRHVNYQLSLSHNSQQYRTLANQQINDPVHLESGSGISMGTPSFGTVSLNGSFSETYTGRLQRSVGVSYSRSLAKTIQFTASLNSSYGTTSMITVFSGLTFLPASNVIASAMLQAGSDSHKETVTLQKNLPIGEGFGYRATVEREQSQSQAVVRTNPLVQANGRYGSYSAELQGQREENSGQMNGSYHISAAGALVYAGGHLGLSRPVSSSFAVVQIEGLADVGVLLDNQEVARTNANGMAYIPTLRSYQENRITFDDRQMAADYLIKRYKSVVTPGLYGGECIYFPVARVQAYGGRLLTESGTPLEYAQVTLHGMQRDFSFTTLSSGEFYFENLVDSAPETATSPEACGDPSPYRKAIIPGMYAATVMFDGSERHFNLLVAASDAMFVKLGEFWLSDPATVKNATGTEDDQD
jgi:outer membrane usher protein